MRGITIFGIASGVVFGLVLALIAYQNAAEGQGSYLLLGLFSSPAGLTKDIMTCMIATPIVWAIIGALAGAAGNPIAKVMFMIAMLIHYGALLIILTQDGALGDWDGAAKFPQDLTLGICAYIAGQIFFWTLYTAAWLTGPHTHGHNVVVVDATGNVHSTAV